MDTITTQERDQLKPAQAKLFREVLKEAAQDRYLSPDEEVAVLKKPRCVVILLNNAPVGFYCPKSQLWNGKRAYRAGTCFISSKHQGQGIMKRVLQEYFDRYQLALSWIEEGNVKSIALFTSLGFVKNKRKDYEGYPGHWYVRERLAVSAENLPVYLRW